MTHGARPGHDRECGQAGADPWSIAAPGVSEPLRNGAAHTLSRAPLPGQFVRPRTGRGWPRTADLRGTPVGPLVLRWPSGHRVVLSGLPGSGKSTLMWRTVVPGEGAARIDSQDARERRERWLPGWLPYQVYRPAVRLVHYARLWQALRSRAGVIVHDCGRTPLVRRWLAWDARRRGLGFHLVVLDVPAPVALAGQRERGRLVSGRAFARHRRAVAGLVTETLAGRLPPGCATALLLDRAAADMLTEIGFTHPAPAAGEHRAPLAGHPPV